MPNTRSSPRTGPRALVRSLAWLRLCAIAGQTIAVITVAWWLRMAIPELPLFVGIGALGIFAVVAAWRLQRPWRVSEPEAVCHVAADTLVLCYLLYLTGGASNPFISLLLVPIALSALALSLRGIVAVALLSTIAYLVLILANVPLPLPMGHVDSHFGLHMIGMAVNFLIMAVILGVFIARVAWALRAQQSEVQRIRERALRDEGILAIATQAAGAAHEMNTPLSTMRTLLPELRREHHDDPQLDADLGLLESQVERCRASLREMVAFGKSQLSREPERTTVRKFLHDCLERFRLLRPEAHVEFFPASGVGDTVLAMQTGLRHALLNLLNNAADASAQNGSQEVQLHARLEDDWLELSVIDRGPGFIGTEELAELGYTRKHTGLGLGLALAEATADRLNGELKATNTGQGGAIRLRLPLSVMRPR